METWGESIWTVDHEKQLWEVEEAFNMSMANTRSKITWWISDISWTTSLSSKHYSQQKEVKKISKIRGFVRYDNLSLANVSKKQDAYAKILANCDASYIIKFYLIGSNKSQTLSRQLVRALASAYSRAPKSTNIKIEELQLPHEKFWRLVFAMRQLEFILITECRLNDIKEIDKAAHIDTFNLVHIMLEDTQFIKLDNSTVCTHSVLIVISTLVNLHRMQSQSKNHLCFNIDWSTWDYDEMQLYMKQKKISHLVKVRFNSSIY